MLLVIVFLAQALQKGVLVGRRRWSDDDVDLAVSLHDVVFFKSQLFVADVGAVRQVKLVAMPGAYNVDVVLVVGLTKIKAAVADHVDNLGHLHAFTGWAALMGAKVLIGIIYAAPKEYADLGVRGLNDPDAALGKFAVAANQDVCHANTYILYYNLYISLCS
jgi:hypothetical protein